MIDIFYEINYEANSLINWRNNKFLLLNIELYNRIINMGEHIKN